MNSALRKSSALGGSDPGYLSHGAFSGTGAFYRRSSREWYKNYDYTHGISPFLPVNEVLLRCWPRRRRIWLHYDGGLVVNIGVVRVGGVRHSRRCVQKERPECGSALTPHPFL